MSRASRRAAIVDAASAVIADMGIAGLTTKAVARQAGVSEAAIYYHFTDKLGLVLAVVEANLPAVRAVMRPLPGRAGSATVAANLAAAARALSRFWYRLLPALGTALGDPGATSRLRIFLDKRHLGPQRAVQAVGQYLSAERGLGRIPEGTDTHAVAVGLLGACQAAAIQARLTGQDEQWAQDQAATAAEGLAGLISRTGPAPG